MGSSPLPPPTGYVSISEAARIIGAKPWDVVRLIESELVEAVQLVELESLRRHQEQP